MPDRKVGNKMNMKEAIEQLDWYFTADDGSAAEEETKLAYATVKQKIEKDALALLREQEPQETRLVRHYSMPGVYVDLWLHCEKCGGRVDDRYKPKYCPHCGRKVKWDADGA